MKPDVDRSQPRDRIRRGTDQPDERADLWRTHGRELLRYATLLVGPDDAGDVVSVALERVSGVDRAVEDLHRYLIRAITNASIDQARSRKRRQVRELRAATAGAVAAFDSNIDVRRAVAGLSVQQRAVIYFTYWEDLDSNQIAELLEVTSATVRRHRARARAILRKVLS